MINKNIENLINNYQSSNIIENQEKKNLNNIIKNENILKDGNKYLKNISFDSQNKNFNNIPIQINNNNNKIESNYHHYDNGKNEITLNNNNIFNKKGLIMNEIQNEKNELDNSIENKKNVEKKENNIKNDNLVNFENNINMINSPSKIEINNELQNKFLKFLTEIKKSSFSKPFKKSPLELIHDKNLKNQYKEKIENPIDLSIVSNKLKNNEYQNVKSFIEDVFLIFNNAMLFNKEDSKIYKFAKSLKIKAQLKFEEMNFLPASGLVRNLRINKKKSKKKKNRLVSKTISNENINNENDNYNKMNCNNKENNNNEEGKLLNKKKLRLKYNFEKNHSICQGNTNLQKTEKIKEELFQNKKNFNKKKILNIQKKNNNKKEIPKENKATNTIIENKISENNLLYENEKIIISKKISKLSVNEIIDVLTYLTHSCNVLTNINEKFQDSIIIDFDKFSEENYKNLMKYLEEIEEKRNLLNNNYSQNNFNISENFEHN